MAHYSITISVDEGNVYQNNFLNLIKTMCDKKEPLSIKPMKTKIFTSDCLFFDDVGSETYTEICKVAEAQSKLELKIESVNSFDEYKNTIETIINEKSRDIIESINKLMTGDAVQSEGLSIKPEISPEAPPDNEQKNAYEKVSETDDREQSTDESEADDAAANDDVKKDEPSEEPTATKGTTAPPEEPDTQEKTNEETNEEDPDLFIDEDLNLDDSDPEESSEEQKPVKAPLGKLYPDNYDYLMASREFQEKSDLDKQNIISAEVGWSEMRDCALESLKNWQNKPFHNYSSYVEKYPEMNDVDKAKFWARSYANYVLAQDIYSDEGKTREFFYTFDSFVRAKLNQDIRCEKIVAPRIKKLYK